MKLKKFLVYSCNIKTSLALAVACGSSKSSKVMVKQL